MNAMRSIPTPKAKPEYFSGSILTPERTLGFTIPAPKSSIQPEFLHVGQPAPLQTQQETSIWAEGSVNGKKDGRKRLLTVGAKSFCANWASVPFKSANEIPSSTKSPS